MDMSPSERRQHWESVISKCELSQKTIACFCKENNIPEHRYYYWKKRLREKHLPVPGFKELSAPPAEGSGLWFDFGNGAKLVIGNEFNSSTFKKLMGVLSGC